MKLRSITLVFLLIAPSIFANHALMNSGRYQADDEKRPKAPTSLSQATKLMPEAMLKGLDKRGDLYCQQVKRIADKLAGGAKLDPETESSAKEEVEMAKVLCDKDGHFVGFPETGTRNEKFVTDFYTIKSRFASVSGIIQQVIPGVESSLAWHKLREERQEIVGAFQRRDGYYRKAFETAFDKMSESERDNALTEYRDWVGELEYFYRTKKVEPS